MEKGFIKLSRKFFESDMWRTPRTYNEGEAWLDLIQSARFEAAEQTARVGGREITWGQGQYPASNRFLAARWQWSEKRVRSFLTQLKRKGMITTECLQGMNIITLVNYRKYNTPDDSPEPTTRGAPTDAPNSVCGNDLLQLLAQQVTHLISQQAENGVLPSENGRSTGAKNKKGKNIITTGDNIIPPKEEKETSPDGEAKKAALSLTPSSADSAIDFDGLKEYFNLTFAGRLPAIRTMPGTRRQAVRARVAQYGKEAVMEVFRRVAASSFLLGVNDRGWRADFDWIFKQQNFTKILEGNYNHETSHPTTHTAASTATQQRRASVSRLKELAAGILHGTGTPDDSAGI